MWWDTYAVTSTPKQSGGIHGNDRKKEEETTMLCRILAMPVKHWLFILTLILLFLALYVVVYAGETGPCPVAIFKAAWLVPSTYPGNNVKICSV